MPPRPQTLLSEIRVHNFDARRQRKMKLVVGDLNDRGLIGNRRFEAPSRDGQADAERGEAATAGHDDNEAASHLLAAGEGLPLAA